MIDEHVLRRSIASQVGINLNATAQYQMPNLKTVDLSWAERLRVGDHPSLSAITEAQVGDAVTLVFEENAWMILDKKNRTLR